MTESSVPVPSGQPVVGCPQPEVEPPTIAPPPASPWSDGFGRLALRSAQTLLVLGVEPGQGGHGQRGATSGDGRGRLRVRDRVTAVRTVRRQTMAASRRRTG